MHSTKKQQYDHTRKIINNYLKSLSYNTARNFKFWNFDFGKNSYE